MDSPMFDPAVADQRTAFEPAPAYSGAAGWSTVPRVNLLPPEILAGRRFRVAVRWYAAAVVATCAVGVAGTWWSMGLVDSAQHQLDTATGQTQALQRDVGKYAEVPRISAAVKAATSAREQAMAQDILWSRCLADLEQATPEGVTLTTVKVTVGGASGAGAAADPLAPTDGIGSIAITGQADSMPLVADWLDALAKVTGLKVPSLGNLTRIADATGASGTAATSSPDGTASAAGTSTAAGATSPGTTASPSSTASPGSKDGTATTTTPDGTASATTTTAPDGSVSFELSVTVAAPALSHRYDVKAK